MMKKFLVVISFLVLPLASIFYVVWRTANVSEPVLENSKAKEIPESETPDIVTKISEPEEDIIANLPEEVEKTLNSYDKLPEFTSDYYKSLSGKYITEVNASNLGGFQASQFLRSDTDDTMTGSLDITAVPTGTGLDQGSLYINPVSASENHTLFGIGVNNGARFRVDAEGDAFIEGDANFSGQGFFNHRPTLVHTGAWATGSTTWNGSDASIYVNPSTAASNSNLISAAVNGSVRFSVDAEGDVYARDIYVEGSTLSSSGGDFSGDVTIDGDLTIGDALGDSITINASTATIPNDLYISGGELTVDTLIAGKVNNILVVDGVKYTTLASAIADCPTTGGCKIYVASAVTIPAITINKEIQFEFAPGVYPVTGTITIQDVEGVRWIGASSGARTDRTATEFYWQGNTTDPMFKLRDVAHSLFKNFAVENPGSNDLAYAFFMENSNTGSSANITPGFRTFEDLVLRGSGDMNIGFHYDTGASNANNDHDTYDRVRVSGYGYAAWDFGHTQAKVHRIYGSICYGDGVTSQRCVRSVGSFYWYGGGAAGNTVADFDFGFVNDAIVISGLNSEGSARLMQSSSFSVGFPILIEGVRWANNAVHADNRVIDYRAHGPLTLMSNLIGSDGNDPLEIYSSVSGNTTGNIAIGNEINTTLSNPFTGGRWTTIGNIVGEPNIPAAHANNIANGLALTNGNLKIYDSDGSNYTSFASPSLSSDITYTLPTTDGADGEVLVTDGSGVLSWSPVSSLVGSSSWTDSVSTTYLADTGDELVLGGTSPLSSAKFSIDGDADQIQLLIQGNSTQTSNLFLLEDSSGNDLITFSGTGATVFNEFGNDADFRFEGDTDANLLYGDAGNNRVGIGVATPDARLEIQGQANTVGLHIDHSSALSGAPDTLNAQGQNGSLTVASTGRTSMTAGCNAAGGTAACGATFEIFTSSARPTLLLNSPGGGFDSLQWENSSGTVVGVINNSGSLGVGDTTPDAAIEVLSTTEQLRLSHTDGTNDARFTVDSSGNLTINVTGTQTTFSDIVNVNVATNSDAEIDLSENGTVQWNIFNDGDNSDRLYITDNDNDNGLYLDQDATSWTANSDIRLKENLIEVEDVLTKLANIKAYKYNFIGTDKTEIGVIAQEIQKEFPELVSVGQDGYLGVSYDRLAPILISAINELNSLDRGFSKNMTLEDLSVSGDVVMGSVVITEKIQIGLTTINGLENSIDTAGILKIQPSALGNIELFAGKIKFNKDGWIQFDSLAIEECNEENRGLFGFVKSEEGDKVQVCAKNSSGEFIWQRLN